MIAFDYSTCKENTAFTIEYYKNEVLVCIVYCVISGVILLNLSFPQQNNDFFQAHSLK